MAEIIRQIQGLVATVTWNNKSHILNQIMNCQVSTLRWFEWKQIIAKLADKHRCIGMPSEFRWCSDEPVAVLPGCEQNLVNGAPGGNRTHDNLLRRQMLYPTELRAQTTRHNDFTFCEK